MNYVVLDSESITGRLAYAAKAANEIASKKAASIYYDRGGF